MELRLMNITAMLLFPSLEGVCRKVATDIALAFPMGTTKEQIKSADIITALLGDVKK